MVTNLPDKFMIRPNAGYLPPGDSLKVTVCYLYTQSSQNTKVPKVAVQVVPFSRLCLGENVKGEDLKPTQVIKEHPALVDKYEYKCELEEKSQLVAIPEERESVLSESNWIAENVELKEEDTSRKNTENIEPQKELQNASNEVSNSLSMAEDKISGFKDSQEDIFNQSSSKLSQELTSESNQTSTKVPSSIKQPKEDIASLKASLELVNNLSERLPLLEYLKKEKSRLREELLSIKKKQHSEAQRLDSGKKQTKPKIALKKRLIAYSKTISLVGVSFGVGWGVGAIMGFF